MKRFLENIITFWIERKLLKKEFLIRLNGLTNERNIKRIVANKEYLLTNNYNTTNLFNYGKMIKDHPIYKKMEITGELKDGHVEGEINIKMKSTG